LNSNTAYKESLTPKSQKQQHYYISMTENDAKNAKKYLHDWQKSTLYKPTINDY